MSCRSTTRNVSATRKPHTCGFCGDPIAIGNPAYVVIYFQEAGSHYDPERDVDADWDASVSSQYYHLAGKCPSEELNQELAVLVSAYPEVKS